MPQAGPSSVYVSYFAQFSYSICQYSLLTLPSRVGEVSRGSDGDEGFNAMAQLVNLKIEKEALTSKKDTTINAKEESKAKVEQLLKDKTELKLLR